MFDDPKPAAASAAPPAPAGPTAALATCLFAGGAACVAVVILSGLFQKFEFMQGDDLVANVLAWTFALFFLPMLALGTVSPQVIRLCVPDIARVGRTAGTVYAWSTAGAIAGTFAAGYLLIERLGTYRVLLTVALGLTGLAFAVGRLWKSGGLLFGSSVVVGGAVAGLFLIDFGGKRYDLETKYYAIRVSTDWPDRPDLEAEEDLQKRHGSDVRRLALDHLLHSYVKEGDPAWLGYTHEQVQVEILRWFRHEAKDEKTDILVIGGGGYTFPRYVEAELPDVGVDVVEIDPGVTEIARRMLGLSRTSAIRSHHLDGRQFVAERAKPGRYRLVVQDAVNDLSVPYHLLMREYNDAVKRTLAPGGAYLLTVIDSLEEGEIWRAAVATLGKTFRHVQLLGPSAFRTANGSLLDGRHVFVIYAADAPLDAAAVRASSRIDGRATRQRQIEPAAAAAVLVPPYSHLALGVRLLAGRGLHVGIGRGDDGRAAAGAAGRRADRPVRAGGQPDGPRLPRADAGQVTVGLGKSESRRSRTLIVGVGNRRATVAPCSRACVRRDSNPAPRLSQSRVRNRYTTDTMISGGLEPPIPSTSGRCLGRWATRSIISDFGLKARHARSALRNPHSNEAEGEGIEPSAPPRAPPVFETGPANQYPAPFRDTSVPAVGIEPTTSGVSGQRSNRTELRGVQRKVRESNSHPLAGNRVSTAARPTVSGYLPSAWTARESHPHFRRAMPASSCWTSSPIRTRGPSGIRTPVSGMRCRRPPAGRTAQTDSCGGRIRTGVGRLMRPCWDRTPVHSAVTEVGVEPTPIGFSTRPLYQLAYPAVKSRGDGGSRTHTERLLRPSPLPVGLHHPNRGPRGRSGSGVRRAGFAPAAHLWCGDFTGRLAQLVPADAIV